MSGPRSSPYRRRRGAAGPPAPPRGRAGRCRAAPRRQADGLAGGKGVRRRRHRRRAAGQSIRIMRGTGVSGDEGRLVVREERLARGGELHLACRRHGRRAVPLRSVRQDHKRAAKGDLRRTRAAMGAYARRARDRDGHERVMRGRGATLDGHGLRGLPVSRPSYVPDERERVPTRSSTTCASAAGGEVLVAIVRGRLVRATDAAARGACPACACAPKAASGQPPSHS